jgi:two-component system, OmpR family, response regulator
MDRVLIIDDDPKLSALLQEYLGGRGFWVCSTKDGIDGLERLQAADIDVVILDVMMPMMDGFAVLQQIRATSKVPVIMLTARGEDTDRIVGLEMGADDYVSKPFNPRELLARIKAVLRRTQPQAMDLSKDDVSAVGVQLNKARREVTVDGSLVTLTTMEFDILHALLSRAGRVVTRDILMEELRGQEWDVYDRSIDVHISHLRKKLNDNSKSPQKIKTIRGVGYLVPK